jgi:hypothetical protein
MEDLPVPKQVKTIGERVRSHRAQLRAQGLRPIQIWVPDVRAPGFKEEARRQALAVAEADLRDDVMDFLEAAQDVGDDG